MGRKKSMKTAEKIDVRLRIDDDFRARIQSAADSEQTTVAGFIRAAVLERLKRIERETQDAELPVPQKKGKPTK